MRRVLKDNCNACSLSFLTKCFSNSSTLMSRIFLLAFFVFIVFPYHKNAIIFLIAWVVKQLYVGMNFVNLVFAETFLSFTRLIENGEKIFHIPLEILQIWYFSHINCHSLNPTSFKHPAYGHWNVTSQDLLLTRYKLTCK